ncbi:glutamate racemase [bacterium]|nr:glutamate racemase [bacterium]MDC1221854.1 glutamate racemase [Salibacteraceae bacterium]
MNNQPIGIFDSGVGGLSIWQHISMVLPNESTVYIADSANAPYGERSKAEIISLSERSTERLLSLGAKIIIVACNTATTNAIEELRSNFKVPFVGIEPATKPAAINTKTGKIGILATKGTLASELFLNTSKQFRGSIEIIETVGTGLVQIIESGKFNQAKPLLNKYLSPMVKAGVDNIVLGCTHYPFLKDLMREILPDSITIIDSGNAVAQQTKFLIDKFDLQSNVSNKISHRILSTGNLETLNNITPLMGNIDFRVEVF